jgi:hypothetical protein
MEQNTQFNVISALLKLTPPLGWKLYQLVEIIMVN